MLNVVIENYDWLAGLVFLVTGIVVTIVGKKLVFLVPAIAEARSYNLSEDKKKKAKEKYPPMIKATRKVGLISNLVLFFIAAPFLVSLEALPVWRYFTDTVAVLMFYDFFYYLTHRFLFHGQGPLRQVHGIHHQARQPTHIDALYVHPVETIIGLGLFIFSIVVVGILVGGFNAIALGGCYVIYTQINVINHTHVDINRFPYKTLTWITKKHHVHHENMHKGNYASITLLFDKIFGTLD